MKKKKSRKVKKITGKQSKAGKYSLNEHVMPGIYDRRVCAAEVVYAVLPYV